MRMRSIGIRVTPAIVYYSIVELNEQDNIDVISIDSIIIPEALNIPHKLSYVRTTLFSIFIEYNIKTAGIRIAEGNTQNISIFRIYLEGVIQELLADFEFDGFYLGVLSRFSKILETDITVIKDFINGNNNEIIDLNSYDIPKSASEIRESLLTAKGASLLFKGGIS